ncbi:26S proteasome regulatory subunit-like protein [Drechmeria coniospora]|uniref:26S proteasome regulatory subunit-like protein n=1 Tax=Drechmeria coniospora TaxID=98403 RepID=A0A151GHW3_DRECN|nr:26S proteasome regulatory subunit-like protein [Drechmeria coniospora]KYK56713.1 26S proteasome regulatory subunit-like protein [Drechmeria coniospora]
MYTGYHTLNGVISEMAYPIGASDLRRRPRTDGDLLNASGCVGPRICSHPALVGTSIAGDGSAESAEGDAGGSGEHAVSGSRGRCPPCPPLLVHTASSLISSDYNSIPKLNRTMTDIYGDELYSPNFTITSTCQSQPYNDSSVSNNVFSQRINAANTHHLSVARSPSFRTRSPFRAGSPFAASSTHSNFPVDTNEGSPGQVAPDDTPRPQAIEPGTPETISPRDAILEFSDPEGDEEDPPLFSQSVELGSNAIVNEAMESVHSHFHPTQNVASIPTSAAFLPTQNLVRTGVPRQDQFISDTGESQRAPFPLDSSGSSSTGSRVDTPSYSPRLASMRIGGGTYTCTYHGCALRFETPSLLQKHKREGHRQIQGLISPREVPGMVTTLHNTQAGPHRCDRINPCTGKPCSTLFSRPYDLTRHEDTIHNLRKQKVRCDLCKEDKTFSRADALTRHYRVCHPDIELFGKRRYGGGVG